MDTEKALASETEKWLKRLEGEMKGLKTGDPSKGVKGEIENINAYISDCRHFQKQKDFVRAFECVVYAWGILETLKRLDLA